MAESLGDNGGLGSSASAGGAHTLDDNTASGHFWNGANPGTHLNETERVTGSLSAVVRVVGQSEAANGSWRKAGVQARDTLATGSFQAMAIAAAGVGSQPGDANAVPLRLGSRIQSDGEGGFELPIQNGGFDIANDIFVGPRTLRSRPAGSSPQTMRRSPFDSFSKPTENSVGFLLFRVP